VVSLVVEPFVELTAADAEAVVAEGERLLEFVATGDRVGDVRI
jgi:hypothetical protein